MTHPKALSAEEIAEIKKEHDDQLHKVKNAELYTAADAVADMLVAVKARGLLLAHLQATSGCRGIEEVSAEIQKEIISRGHNLRLGESCIQIVYDWEQKRWLVVEYSNPASRPLRLFVLPSPPAPTGKE